MEKLTIDQINEIKKGLKAVISMSLEEAYDDMREFIGSDQEAEYEAEFDNWVSEVVKEMVAKGRKAL